MSPAVDVEWQPFHDTLSSDTDFNLVSLLLPRNKNLSSQSVKDTTIASFTADYLSTYLSLVPSPSDAVLSFGPMDFLLTSAPHYLPSRLYNVYPHPAQDPSEKRKYISMLTSRYVVDPFRRLVLVVLRQYQKRRCPTSTCQGYVYKVVERVRPPRVRRPTRRLNWVCLGNVFSFVLRLHRIFQS